MHYDLILIGAGPGGYETAAEAAKSGLKTLVIERDELGGTCLNRGCIPTKCLCSGVETNYAAAVARAADVIAQLRQGVADALADVDIVHGESSLAAGPKVLVGGNEYTADKIIIATGSRPASLRCPGADLAINSDAFLALTELPKRLTIIGGGVIGLEFASIAASFGSEATILEYAPEILPAYDAEIAKRLRSYLGRRGIDIIVSAQVTAIADDMTVTYTKKGKEKTVAGDMVLCAVGRRPVVPDGCAEAGIELDKRGYIITDDAMRTTAPGIYAIGDVNGRCLLAHAASAQGRLVLGEKVNLDIMPSVVFTTPECASVAVKSDETASVKIPFGANGKALASGQENGLLKLDYDPATGKITGCHVVGAHAADLIAVATLALNAGMTMKQLSKEIIFAHPTLSELVAQAANLG